MDESTREAGEASLATLASTLFLVDGVVAALVGGKRLRARWLEEVRRSAGGVQSLLEFIALPREEGRPVIPGSRRGLPPGPLWRDVRRVRTRRRKRKRRARTR